MLKLWSRGSKKKVDRIRPKLPDVQPSSYIDELKTVLAKRGIELGN